MFTGIIEDTGIAEHVASEKGNMLITIRAPFAGKLKTNESVSHNGACLSVIPFTKTCYKVMAVTETLNRTNLKEVQKGCLINLERSMPANGRIDGHFVLGHIDETVKCLSVKKLAGSHIFTFNRTKNGLRYIIEKGSIALNGVSLTIASHTAKTFSVAIIPYTYTHTNFKNIKPGSIVNVEYDVLGKYAMQRDFD